MCVDACALATSCCKTQCNGCMNVAWALFWGGSRSTKPCIFPCKVASAGDERYLGHPAPSHRARSRTQVRRPRRRRNPALSVRPPNARRRGCLGRRVARSSRLGFRCHHRNPSMAGLHTIASRATPCLLPFASMYLSWSPSPVPCMATPPNIIGGTTLASTTKSPKGKGSNRVTHLPPPCMHWGNTMRSLKRLPTCVTGSCWQRTWTTSTSSAPPPRTRSRPVHCPYALHCGARGRRCQPTQNQSVQPPGGPPRLLA